MSTQTTERKVGSLRAGERCLPLTKMEIAGSITGLLQRTKVCQTFVNDHDVPLEAVYTHPLPPKASVHGFRLVIGDRVVEGRVQERGAARKAYARAVSKGHRAALMEEERSDIFTTTVGNIAPGEQVSITFELSGPLEFLESTASLRFPLVVPEVYIAGNPLGGGDVGEGTSADTDSVPDASRITPPRLAHGAANPVDLRLSFQVDPAGLELEKVDSLCHFAKTRLKDDGCYEISLLPGVERMDRDFVVRLKLKESSLQTTLIHDPETGTFALTVVPPLSHGKPPAPRDLVIVLDRSGSMQGWSMTAARRAAARMVESLTPLDRFALIAFDDQLEMLDPHLVPAELRHQERAQEFLSKIEARGGTEARPALDKALQILKLETSADKTVLFITDGDVGNDSELVVRAASGVRVTTVGIGHNSRAGVLESMAKTSGGVCSIIPEQSTLEESLRTLHQRLGRPHWMGVSVEGMSASEQAPRYWDVWEGVPVTFFGRASGLGEEVRVEGWLASTGRYSQQVKVRRRDDLVIHRSWARARLLDLDDLWTIGKADQSEMVALSVEAQVLCRFTAFAAIDTSEVVARTQEIKTVVQPVEPTLQAPAPARSAMPMACRFQPPPADDGLFGGEAAFFDVADEADCFAAPCAAPLGLFDEAPSSGWLGTRGECDEFADDAFFDADELCEYDVEVDYEKPQAPGSTLFGRLKDGIADLQGRFQSAKKAKEEAPPSGISEMLKTVWINGEGPVEPDAKKDSSASSRPTSIWRKLLELLTQLLAAASTAKTGILEQMLEALGQHCRKTPTSSAEATTAKEVMSLLVDLQQTVEDGGDERPQVETLRSVLESLDQV